LQEWVLGPVFDEVLADHATSIPDDSHLRERCGRFPSAEELAATAQVRDSRDLAMLGLVHRLATHLRQLHETIFAAAPTLSAPAADDSEAQPLVLPAKVSGSSAPGHDGELRNPGQGEGAKADIDGVKEPPQVLSPLQDDVLEALRNLKATDYDKRATGPAITAKVGGEATEQSVKAPLGDLKRRGLVDSKTGRKGGTWITPAGLVPHCHITHQIGHNEN
jgi:hypothetical protein